MQGIYSQPPEVSLYTYIYAYILEGLSAFDLSSSSLCIYIYIYRYTCIESRITTRKRRSFLPRSRYSARSCSSHIYCWQNFLLVYMYINIILYLYFHGFFFVCTSYIYLPGIGKRYKYFFQRNIRTILYLSYII